MILYFNFCQNLKYFLIRKCVRLIFHLKTPQHIILEQLKMSSSSVVDSTAATVATTTDVTTVSLTERITKVEELLKELKRAAKQLEKQVGRRRRRVPRGQKGETPQQLRAWHEEVHRVWDDMKKTDKATLYKKAVAEAARRRGATTGTPAATAPVVAAPVAAVVAVTPTKGKRAAKATATA
jgi:hypothetical protein